MTRTSNWRDQAACAGLANADYDPFFGETAEDEETALEICDECESQPECLDYAVETAQPFGIWGGYPRHELDRLIAADRAGRTLGAIGHFNAAKDRCKRGHAFTKANTYYDPAGRRHCRTCRRAAERRISQGRRRSA